MGHGNHWEAIGGEAEEVVAHWIPVVVSNGVLTASTKFDLDDGENPQREEEAFGIVYPQTPPSLSCYRIDGLNEESANQVLVLLLSVSLRGSPTEDRGPPGGRLGESD